MFLSLYDVKVSLMVQTFKSIKDDALKTRNQISVLLAATPLRADPWSVGILCSEGIVTASIERLSSDRERQTVQGTAPSSSPTGELNSNGGSSRTRTYDLTLIRRAL